MKGLVKKTQIVPFINLGTKSAPEWRQIKKSTSFTLAMNPQSKTYDFISSDNPEEEITGYQPSLAQSITMFKGEADYQAFFDMLFKRPTGGGAHRDVLIVFYQENGKLGSDDVYKAWLVDSMVKLNQLDTVNESIDVDLAFNQITIGAITLTSGTPSFTAGSWEGDVFTAGV